jgi:hypothetical protein
MRNWEGCGKKWSWSDIPSFLSLFKGSFSFAYVIQSHGSRGIFLCSLIYLTAQSQLCRQVSKWGMIVNDEFGRMWKDMVMPYSKVSSHHLHVGIEENY